MSVGNDPVNNPISQKINEPVDAGTTQHADNNVELMKSASKLAMNSPIEGKEPITNAMNESGKATVEGGKIAKATDLALTGGLNAVTDLHVLKQFSQGIGQKP